MKNFYVIILTIFFVCFLHVANAQNISNEGTEFWTVFPTHLPNPGNLATMNVNVTSRSNTEVTVSCGSTTETKLVPANTVVTFLVDRAQSYIDVSNGNQKLINRGIHIKVTPGMPKIVAYSHVFASARSAATLILPVEALGQKYFSMNYNQDPTGQNFLAVIAAEDNTDLILHKKDGTTIPINNLNKGDVYEYILPVEDLTGTFIETAASSSCKKFAAFSGSSAIRIGGNSGGIDPLLQQLYAISSWGKTYGVVPFINRRYIVRVLAQEDNTSVQFDGIPTGTINKGQFIERVLTVPTIVSADKLISVAEYSYTQEFSDPNGGGLGIGDPEMVLLNPIEFNIKNITLFSSDKFRIDERYINVFMKTNKSSSFKINGLAPSNGVWQPMPSDASYSYIQISVFDESLTLTADDGFNAIAYGFGNHESYAYSAGTNLASSQFIIFVNKTTTKETASACVGQESDLKITLSYPLDKIKWIYGDGTPDDEIINPVAVTSGSNPVLYTYTSPVSKTFNLIGPKEIRAIATVSASAGSCYSSEIELIFPFNVDPLPKADFMMAATGCAKNAIAFTDNSDSLVPGKVITKWLWDFGDPSSGAQNTSDQPSPTHIYTTPGTYTVTLSVGAENGCMSIPFPQNIIINPKPEAKFTAPVDFCVNRDLVITNLSSIANGGIIKNYSWDFGDGVAPILKGSSIPPVFKYATPGLKTIKLTVTSDKDCVSEVFSQNVNIVALPTVDFETPGYCVNDGLAKFKNLSKDYDGTTANLMFEWNFGDGTPSVGPSSIYDGEHTYTAPGRYDVTLKVFNQFGCEADTKLISFIVNPFVTAANFDVKNESNLCSGNDVIINNTSTISNPGTILKIEIYKDYINDPTSFVTILNPLSEDILLDYPEFGGNTDKTYSIRMVAYSGETCFKEVTKIITIKPSPQLEFSAIPAVCVNAGLVRVNLANETSGILGVGTYSGVGIVDATTGLFDPRIAGVGQVHQITYTFNPVNGCTNTISQNIIILPAPSVDAGNDFYILAGGEKQIAATASGVGLTYEWTPAIGLSDPNILNPIASPEFDTKYTVKVISSQGCYTFDEVLVHVLQKVEATNTFTPNGDGINDVWNIKYLDTYPNSTVEIFDRNGQQVYLSSKGYANPFDGTYRGKALPIGTYYYIINPNSGRKNITGSLTIIR